MGGKNNGKGEPITVGGILYKSLKDATIHYNLNYSTVRKRLFQLGWTIDEAFELVKRIQSKPLVSKKIKPKRLPKWIHEGKEYYSDSEIARAYGIPPATFSRKIRKGLPLEKVLIKKEHSKRSPRKSRAKTFFTVRDKIFKNKLEAAKFYNKDYRKVLNRLIAGWDMDTIFGTLDDQILPLYIHGTEYTSVEDVCDVYKLNLREIYKRLKNGLTVKEIFNIENIDVLIVDGKETTIEEAIKNIDNSLYSARIGRGWSIERALSTNTSKKKRKIGKVISAYGIDYMSIKHMAETHNVPYNLLLQLISYKKMDPEKALEKIKKKCKDSII